MASLISDKVPLAECFFLGKVLFCESCRVRVNS